MEQPPKKRVLHVITKSNWGGAQRYVFDIATRLPKDVYDVEVALGGTGILAERLHNEGVPVITVPRLGRDLSPAKDLIVLFSLIRLFWRRRPHVVHLNSSKIGALGALAARLTSVPRIIFTAHGWAFNENRSLWSKAFIKMVYWATMVFSHETIAVSEYMRSQVEAWPWIRSKISVAHNGVEASIRMSKREARERLSTYSAQLADIQAKHPNALWIGTVAELHPVKGHEYAILALKEMVQERDIKEGAGKIVYVMVGDGESRDELNRLINELGLAETVFMIGHVERASECMPAFDIFMLSSLSEGLGYVLLEAGMASLPVVATAVGGIPEIVEDMESGILVQPKSARELAHALRFFIQHPEEASAYGSSLHDRIKKEFSLESMIEATVRQYEAT